MRYDVGTVAAYIRGVKNWCNSSTIPLFFSNLHQKLFIYVYIIYQIYNTQGDNENDKIRRIQTYKH